MLAPFAVLAVFGWVQVLPGGPYYQLWVQDIFVPLEGTLHLLHGDAPHRAFGTPVGLLYLLPHYLAARVWGLSASTVVQANTLVALAVAAAALAVARTRLPPWAGAMLALYAGLVAASPRQLGAAFDEISYNATYNRYGWALAVVTAVLVALRPGARRPWPEGVAVGLLLVAAFLVKVTFALVGLGLLCAAALTVRRGEWRLLVVAAGTVLSVLLAVQASTGLVGAYLADLRLAAMAQTDPVRWGQAIEIARASLPGSVLVLLTGVAAGRERRWTDTLARAAMVGAIIAGGVALGTQNHLARENPLLPVAGLVAWFGIDRQVAGRTRLFRGGVVALVGLFGQPLLLDAAAVGWTLRAPLSHDPVLTALAGTPLQGLRLAEAGQRQAAPDGPPPTELQSDVEYVELIGDGLNLLRRHVTPSSVVLPLTWTNPFPVLLHLPPVPHELLWWDAGRTFSPTVKPSAAALLGSVDYVMIPKSSFNYAKTLAMRAAYADVLEQAFIPAEESRFWLLLKRR